MVLNAFCVFVLMSVVTDSDVADEGKLFRDDMPLVAFDVLEVAAAGATVLPLVPLLVVRFSTEVSTRPVVVLAVFLAVVSLELAAPTSP